MIDRYEQCKPELATHSAAIPLDSAEMPPVQFHRVQVSRAGVARRFLRSALAAACPLCQLLATILLIYKGKHRMNDETVVRPQFPSEHGTMLVSVSDESSVRGWIV
ncbi:MAG: hypothetical protein WB524_14065 [Acidobacteriaceae bacterium]